MHGGGSPPSGSYALFFALGGGYTAFAIYTPFEGTSVEHLVGEGWHVAVVSITEDAWPIIRETNMFNEPPAPGRQYVMARLRLTNGGTQPRSPWLDLTIRYLGSDAVVYGIGEADACGVIPEPIYDIDELFPGGTAEANVCWSVPTVAVKGGRIMVEEWSAANDVRVFFEGVK